jgi:endo-1,4-beta-D-glucanase Y
MHDQARLQALTMKRRNFETFRDVDSKEDRYDMLFDRRILRLRTAFIAATLCACGIIGACRPVANPGPVGSGGAGGSTTSQAGGTTASGGSAAGGTIANGGAASGGSAVGGASIAGGAGGTGGTTASGGAGGGGKGDAGGMGGTSSIPDAAVDSVPDVAPPSRGPAPAQPGHSHPFPQNRENSRCIYPTAYRNEAVQAAYNQWKNDTVTSNGADGFRRVQRPADPGLDPNSTVSEGIGYGMLIAVYMDDESLFDDLWQYEQKNLDGATGLMNWYINAAGTGPDTNGSGPATDADEDMAFALVMAGKQWGGQGKLGKNYSDIALDQIIKVWNNEIFNYKYLKPWPTADSSTINLSYFAPAYYKIFAKIDTADPSRNWTALTDTMYTVLNASLNSSNGNTNNGLVPAWCDSSGKPNGGAFGPTGGPSPTNYQYDSCRTPFRIGLDYCWNGETRAQAYVAKTSSFFSGITVAKMVDGYALNGNPQPQYQTGANALVQSSAFIGPAGVGAMSSSTYQGFVDDAYAVLITGKALVGGTYYDDSWMVMSLLMMSANFLDYTAN